VDDHLGNGVQTGQQALRQRGHAVELARGLGQPGGHGGGQPGHAGQVLHAGPAAALALVAEQDRA
jgi:hypothetical protein